MGHNTLPETALLTKHLSKLFEAETGAGELELVSRSSFRGSSTFPAEVLRCKLPGGREVALFGKYLAGLGPNNHGHRGGVEYEIRVYDALLRNLPLTKANYWGRCRFDETNEVLLLTDFLEGSYSLKGNQEINLYLHAAAWIAHMHNFFEEKVDDFVKVYDHDYYEVWMNRMEKDESVVNSRPWLQRMIDYFRSNIGILLKTRRTLIHGEYYSKNILIRDNVVYPVDWESAAYAVGEVDLASIIEARKPEVAAQIRESYCGVRFQHPRFDKEGFEKRLLMAQFYLHLRFFYPKKEEWRFDHMHAIGKKLEIF
jgi:thiamine kinase-like enzyme